MPLDLDKIDLGGFGVNDQQTQLNANMTEAVKVNPDQHAQTTKLSKESGVPEFAVQSNPEQIQQKLKLDQINLEGMTERAPKTSKFLTTDVNNSVIAQEDVVSNLLEGIERTFDGISRSIGIGFETQGRGLLLAGNEAVDSRIENLIPAGAMPLGMEFMSQDLSREFAANFGIETDEQLETAKAATSDRLIGEIQTLQKERQTLTPEDLNIVQEGVRAGVESLANMAPGMALTVLSGGRTAPLLATIGAQTFSASFGESRADGLTSEEAAWFATIDAAIEVGTEILPTGTIQRMLTGKSTGMRKEALKFVVQEMGTEQLATALQTVNSVMFGLDKELENAEGAQEIIDIQLRRQAVTAIATVVAGGAQITAATAVNKTIAKLTQTEQEAETQGQVEQRNIDKLSADSTNSKLRERDVESFKQFIREADGENNTHVFIDGVQTSLFLQSKTREEIEADPALKSLANAARESRATGADVAVPVDEFMGDIAGTDAATELREHMTMSDETVSPFRQEQHEVETKAYVETLMAEAQENASQYVEAQEIYTTVRDQLIDTGAVNAANASIMAQVVPAWATAQAARSGKTVQQVYTDAGLVIEGPQTGELSRLEGEQVLTQGVVFDPDSETPSYPLAPRGEWYGDSDFAARGGKVVMMNPQEYIDSVRPLTRDEETLENVEDLRNHIEEGNQLDPLTIYEGGQEDGRHRALAAIDLGIEQVPVILFGEQVERFPDVESFADDQGLLAQSPVDDANLVVTHNITEEGIRQAEALGGLASPSIAVANVDIGFDSFGEISLIADPALLDEKKTRTFDTDIYSSRQPRADEQLDIKQVRVLGEGIDASIKGTKLHNPTAGSITSKNALDGEATQLHYLSTIGKAPKQKKMKENKISKSIIGVPAVDVLEDPNFVKNVADKYNKMVSDIKTTDPTVDQEFLDDIASTWFNFKLPEGYEVRKVDDGFQAFAPDGTEIGKTFASKNLVIRRTIASLKQDGITGGIDYTSPKQDILRDELSKARSINDGIDMSKLRDDIRKKMDQKSIKSGYKKWLDDTYNTLVKSKRLFAGYTPSGDRKYKPYNLDTLVREMNKKLQGGESSNYGITSVRAMYANEMSTKEKVKANRDKIVSSEEMEDIKADADIVFEDAMEELKQYYKYDTDGFGYMSDVAEAITEGPSGIRDVFGNSPEANKIVNDLGKYLAALPTEYFEAKLQRAMDFSEFKVAVVPKSTSKETVDLLKSKGITVKTYDSSGVGKTRQQVIAEQKKLLFQKKPDTGVARGYYDPENSVIRLTESADLSTFLHEFAHFMYEMEASGNTDMNESINNWYKRNAEDVAAEATKYLNGQYDPLKQGERSTDKQQTVTEADVVNYLDTGSSGSRDKDNAVRRAVHEQFARGFETYLMEGKAPSVELRNAFRTFARWLARIYQALRGDLNVKLDAEMRQVFDRLLATEEQIAAAESRARVEPMFTDATMAGMTAEEFSDYQQRQEKVKDIQTETLRDKLIKALTRKTQQWWKEEKADLTDEELGRLAGEQVYSTATRLRDGDIKLDHATVKEMVGEERTDKLGRTSTRVSDKLRGMTAKGQKGVHPDEAAAFFGYTSGAEMLNDLMTAPPIKETAEANAEARMIERHGDVFTDGTIERQADEAVQNEERGKLILHELKILSRGTNQRSLDRQTMKSIAAERIGNLSFREIHPGKYRKAEIRAAQEAARMLAEGNKEGAAQAKARQALNYYLGMEATTAKNDTVKIVDRMNRYNKKKVREEIQKAEGGYWEQIVKVLERFEFRKSATLGSVDQVNQDINTWAAERMDTHGDGLVLANVVLNESYVTHWKNVAYSDLQGIDDSVKNIEHVARYSNKLTRMGEEIEYNKLVEKLVTTAAETGTGKFKKSASVADDLSWIERKGRWAMGQMTKIPYMMSWMDGMDRVGTWFTTFSQPMTDAYNAELEMFEEVGKPVTDMIKNRSKEDEKRHNTTFFIPEIKGTAGGTHTGNLKGHEIIAVALNTGNEGNLRKLLLGEQWATEDTGEISLQNDKLVAVLKHMTKSDWQMVQKIWDQIDILYPKLAEVHRRTTGLVPPKVEATPVVTEHGTFKGGYYPVKYDPTRDNKAAEFEERKEAEVGSMFASNASIQSSVNTGATNERTGYFAPIHLTLNVVPNHIQETIHYITHHDAVREVNRLLRDPRVKDAVTSKLGPEEFAQLKPWLNDIAKDGRNAPNKSIVDAMFNKLRLGTTLGVMGFKASTGIIQISGLSNTIAEVGLKNVYESLRTILGSVDSMKSAWEFATEKSKVLKHRTQTMDREIMNAMQQLESKRGVLAAVQEVSMKHIALIQTYMVDLPSWHAAYIKELGESGDEKKAFQYADWVIENVQGSGATKDMAALMRNQTKTHTIFTMFMTFFSALWNLQRDLVKGTKSGKYSTTTVAAKTMFLFTIPVLFEMIMRGEFAKEDEEPEELLQNVLTKVALYPIASIPFVRDVVNGVVAGYGYNASPVTSIVEQGLQGLEGASKAVLADGELTKGQIKSISKLAGATLGIPGTGQAWATGEHLYDVLAEGEEFTTHQFLFGPERK